jgi:hypothetical protein
MASLPTPHWATLNVAGSVCRSKQAGPSYLISVNPQPEARRYGKAVTVGPPSAVTFPYYPEKLAPADTPGLLFVCYPQHGGGANEGGSHDITQFSVLARCRLAFRHLL